MGSGGKGRGHGHHHGSHHGHRARHHAVHSHSHARRRMRNHHKARKSHGSRLRSGFRHRRLGYRKVRSQGAHRRRIASRAMPSELYGITVTSRDVLNLIEKRHKAMVWRVQCRQKFLEQMGFFPGFENSLPSQDFPNLTRDEIAEVLSHVKTKTPQGVKPTEDEVEYIYHCCVTRCDDFIGEREEGDEVGVTIFDIQFVYSTYFVLNDRPEADLDSRIDQFWCPDGSNDGRGTIGDEELFIIMNDIIGNLLTPIVNASMIVDVMEPPPDFDEDDDFDELPSYEAALAVATKDKEIEAQPPNYKTAIEEGEDREVAVGVELLRNTAVSLTDVERVKRMADFNITERDNVCHRHKLRMALNYWSVEHDLDDFQEWDCQPLRRECCTIA